eukprot:68844_1
MSAKSQTVFELVTKRWLRIYTSNHTQFITTNDFVHKLLDTIWTYINEDINELFVNIAVVGDDCCDKIGLIYNYIHDYNCSHLLRNGEKSRLIKQNESTILHFTKTVPLSARNRVNISIACLSQHERHHLSTICTQATKSIIFSFNLCDQNSLQNVRKWYKDCVKCCANGKCSFIPILVGTNYEHFKNKAANYRISVIEQSRKYASKMSAILLFISTFDKQQININEIFLIILSKIFMFESNISAISNSKLPIIEFYDHKKKHKSKKKPRSNTMKRTSALYKHTPYKRAAAHAHTKTSIEDIQSRLSVIRSNLKHKNSNKRVATNSNNKVEKLYNRFEKQYETFMQQKNEEIPMYPSFMHYSQSTPIDAKPQLSDLLKGDALGLHSLHNEEEDTKESEEMVRKQRKHERAMSMMPSLLNRAKTYDHNTTHRTQLRGHGHSNAHHNRAMPSMPNFLSKLQNDNQLKSIISNVFTQSIQPQTKHKKHQHQHKIGDLEKTIQGLKDTIAKMEAKREAGMNAMNGMENEEQMKVLKDKNKELQTLADALSINLKRKQQSLEEALHAIHTLGVDEEEERSISRSLTDGSKCEPYVSSEDDQCDSDRRQSFTKGIARKLRSLSSSLTQMKTDK